MSRPRYKFYGYMKNVARAYPEMKAREANGPPLNRPEKRELEAVEYAIDLTARIPKSGKERIRLIELTLFKGLTLEAAASRCFVSYSVARRWVSEFIVSMAEYMGIV